VLLVLASASDQIAAAFTRASAGRARLVTAADLSTPGWLATVPARGAAVAAVGGEQVPSAALDGVLVRLDLVRPSELGHIVPADRAYVAAEMTAFLRYWLSLLDCPVLNPPGGACLSGPGWPAEQWLHAAAGAGLAARTATPGQPLEHVTVVGDRVLGPAWLHAIARTLSRAAGTPLLEVTVQHGPAGAAVIGANPWPDIGEPHLAAAIWRLLGREVGC
jgi:hypothetical protein